MADEPVFPRDYYTQLENSGYEAGLSGKRMEDSTLWSEAWNGASGSNLPGYVLAGWVAGRAMRRVKQEMGNE